MSVDSRREREEIGDKNNEKDEQDHKESFILDLVSLAYSTLSKQLSLIRVSALTVPLLIVMFLLCHLKS